MLLRDDVLYAHEGGVIVVGDDGEWIEADGGYLFDRFRFHIAVCNHRPCWVGQVECCSPIPGSLVSRRRRGAVVIMAPMSSMALESSREVWTSWTMV